MIVFLEIQETEIVFKNLMYLKVLLKSLQVVEDVYNRKFI